VKSNFLLFSQAKWSKRA